MRKRMVEPHKSGGVDHREIERQHKDFRPQRNHGSERGQNIENQLRAEDGEIEAGAQQKQICEECQQHGEGHHQPDHFVRQEKEQSQWAERIEQAFNFAQLLDISRHDSDAPPEAGHFVRFLVYDGGRLVNGTRVPCGWRASGHGPLE